MVEYAPKLFSLNDLFVPASDTVITRVLPTQGRGSPEELARAPVGTRSFRHLVGIWAESISARLAKILGGKVQSDWLQTDLLCVDYKCWVAQYESSILNAEHCSSVYGMAFTSSSVNFELSPLPPFRLDLTAWALRRRPENQVDRWDGTTYRRVICIQDRRVEVSVCQRGRPDVPRLAVNARGDRSAARAKPEIVTVLTYMLGLQLDLTPFYRMARRDPKLRGLAERYRGLKPVRFPTVFEALANAFACQQFTMAAGIQLLNRLAQLGSVAMETPDGKMFGFPQPADLLRLSPRTFRRLGFSRQKTRAFHDLSRGILAQRLDFQTLTNCSNEEATKFLLGLRGVGRWTAEYVLLRGLGRLDVFPGDDVGARNRLAKWLHRRKPMDYAIVNRALRRWQPYAGFIYLHMLMESLTAAGRISA